MSEKHLIATLMFMIGSVTQAATLNVGVPNRIHSLSPLNTSFTQERYILPLIYRPLFQLDVEQNIKPVLAESFKEVKPGVVRIKIKENQKFHDGTEIEAKDILNSISALCKKASRGVQTIRSIYGCGKSDQKLKIDIISRKEIDFHIRSSANFFLYELASGYIFAFKENEKNITGSGDYRIDTVENGNASLNRIRGSGIEKINFIYVNDEDLDKALEKNEIDVGSMYRESDLKPEKLNRFNSHRTSNYVTQILVLNPKIEKKIGKLKLLRIKNRIRQLNPSLCGHGRVLASGVVPDGIGGHIILSPDKTESFREKGKTGKKIKLTIYQAMDRANHCENEKIKLAFDEAGVEIGFKLEKNYPSLIKVFGQSNVDGYIELFNFSRDASRFFDRLTPKTSQPFLYIQSKSIESRLNEAISKSKISERFSIYREISKEIQKSNTIIPLYYQGHLSVTNKCVSMDMNPNNNGLNLNTFLFLKELNIDQCRKNHEN
jgi:ABC-type transport system substrate-binding protein